MMWVKLTNAPHLNFLGNILIKYSKDTQQLLILNNVRLLQNEI
jgi:hypothetical protein